MKILITYYSQTGNTKKVAEAIYKALEKQDLKIKPIEEVDPTNLKLFDLVIIGSGVYASRVHSSLIKLLKKAPDLPNKFAYFCTHASLELYQTPFKKVTKLLEKNGVEIVGKFDCVGENLGISEEKQKEMLKQIPSQEREKALKDKKKAKGRPNAQDLNQAKKFATSLI
jgi:flavodoxin I